MVKRQCEGDSCCELQLIQLDAPNGHASASALLGDVRKLLGRKEVSH